jgi:hypothetical protein
MYIIKIDDVYKAKKICLKNRHDYIVISNNVFDNNTLVKNINSWKNKYNYFGCLLFGDNILFNSQLYDFDINIDENIEKEQINEFVYYTSIKNGIKSVFNEYFINNI